MSHPTRQLATTVIEALGNAGTDTIFGVPGGGANLEIVGAGVDAGMRFVLTHGETAACIAAGTYGLLREQPGAVTVTRGPGAASAVNGIAQATLDRYPLLLVSDVVSAAQRERVAHQRLDQPAMMRPAAKWSGTIGSGDASSVAAAAVELAQTAPMGGVHLDFDPSASSDQPPARPVHPASVDPASAKRAEELLAEAHRPVVLVGAEAWPWYEDVRAFIDATDCPTLTTYQARGLVSDRSPHVAGVFTNAAIERSIVDRADLILAVGLDPVEPIPADWTYAAPQVSLMPWPLEDRYYEPTIELVGPLGPPLELLQAHTDATGWEQGSAFTARDDALTSLRQHAHMLVAVPMLTVTQPRGMLISNGLATMGFALPAAIFVFTIVVLGGPGTVMGPVLGAVLFWFGLSLMDGLVRAGAESGWLPDVMTSGQAVGAIRFILVGLALSLLMAKRPQGILGSRREMSIGGPSAR